MLVDNIGADARMDSAGDIVAIARSQEAEIRVSKVTRTVVFGDNLQDLVAEGLIADHFAQSLTKPEVTLISQRQSCVDIRKLVCHTEATLIEGVGHILTGLADQRQLEIVDAGRSVACNQSHHVPLDQIDQQRAKAILNKVRTGKEHDRLACLA